ncbi:MAG TPA: hypothetical protein VJ570_06095, partial [Holophagaceae bacterium]|nr:hypothetical protein [Holophagaceae bacterium]
TVGLDHRATRQAWFELQQAQEAYESLFLGGGISFPDMAQHPRFANLKPGFLIDNTCFMIPKFDPWVLAALNSQGSFQQIRTIAASVQGATIRFKRQYVEELLIPELPAESPATTIVSSLISQSDSIESHRRAFLRFLRQDAPWQLAPVGEKLEAFWELDEATALAEALKRRNKKLKEPTLGDRDFLKRSWREAREPILELRGKIAALETELDAAVDAAWEA